jgi:hypothetical protein
MTTLVARIRRLLERLPADYRLTLHEQDAIRFYNKAGGRPATAYITQMSYEFAQEMLHRHRSRGDLPNDLAGEDRHRRIEAAVEAFVAEPTVQFKATDRARDRVTGY